MAGPHEPANDGPSNDPSVRWPWLRTTSDVSWRFLVVLGALFAIGIVLARLQLVLVPIFVALLLSTALAPPVRWLERRRVPTALATAVVFIGSFLVVGLAVAAIVPPVIDEFSNLGPTLEEASDDIEDWLVDGPFGLERRDVTEYRDSLGDRATDLAGQSSGGVLAGARTALEILAGLILSLVLAFFFVKDARTFQRWGLSHLPLDRREFAGTAAAKAWRTLGNYLLGAATIGLLEAVVIGLAVGIAGGGLIVPVMVLTFAAAFFPIVGAIVAGTVAVLVTFVSSGFGPAIAVLVVVVLVQQFDTDLLAPLVYGRAVRLHPVVVLVALTAGGVVAGLVGAFVAVPITAVISAVGGEVWNRRTAADPRFSTEVA
ncbi:MAG: AI-2E family transporter, partial [Acidimicrobiia bacterium]